LIQISDQVKQQHGRLFAGSQENRKISQKQFFDFPVFEHFYRNDPVKDGPEQGKQLPLRHRIKPESGFLRGFIPAMEINHLTEIRAFDVLAHFKEHQLENF
jgi:hypothetical protein